LHTSESVTSGHPDKIADQISDAVLDATLAQDPDARVACETLVTTGTVVIAGEITTSAYVDIAGVARQTIRDIGYDKPAYGFDGDTCGVLVAIDAQSPDIAQGVDSGGAGDQGMMHGYATAANEDYLPIPIYVAHRLTSYLEEARVSGRIPFLRPDGKAQVTIDPELRQVRAVVVSAQHDPGPHQDDIRYELQREVVEPVLLDCRVLDDQRRTRLLDSGICKVFINPTGKFVLGGPVADAGLTGRKIVADTYGGWIPVGGGAFSGKDPSKVDRSAAYAARWAAKNVVASALAFSCHIVLAYSIGVVDPVQITVTTDGAEVDPERISKAVREVFDFTPKGIIEALDLRRPIYRATATGAGHFGDMTFPWERLDRTDELRAAVYR
jgi:S-adenosylmethionine synthetase